MTNRPTLSVSMNDRTEMGFRVFKHEQRGDKPYMIDFLRVNKRWYADPNNMFTRMMVHMIKFYAYQDPRPDFILHSIMHNNVENYVDDKYNRLKLMDILDTAWKSQFWFFDEPTITHGMRPKNERKANFKGSKTSNHKGHR